MRFFRNVSIKRKLILIILIVAFFAILTGFITNLYFNIQILKKDMVSNTKVNANLMSEYCVTALTFGDTRSAEEYFKKLDHLPSIANVIIYNEDHEVFLTYEKSEKTQPPKPDIDKSHFFKNGYLHVFQPIVYQDIILGDIYIRANTDMLKNEIRRSYLILGIAMVFILTASYFLALKLQNLISRPIHSLTDVIEEMSKKPDFSMRVANKGTDELGMLYSGFNTMLEQLHNREMERDKAEDEIKASLREKEVMLKEIHHRVKNNMQVICSLLNLQSRYIEDSHALSIFMESQNRIRSMALIHEKLYRSQDLASIDFPGYIETLLIELERTYGVNPNKIELNVKVKDVSLSIDNAVPFGLVINEIVSNSLKHAFPESMNGKGCIDIQLKENKNNQIWMKISDNGVGIPEDIDFRNTDSLGLRLAVILVEDQLKGSIEMKRNHGTEFVIIV